MRWRRCRLWRRRRIFRWPAAGAQAPTKIRAVVTRNEQAAAFMACGYAIYSNRLGVCFATAGPGAFNLFSGLAVAMSDLLSGAGDLRVACRFFRTF
ncbi:MAG: thiamine pyrophosphate-binding protein [Xanthobacteraceae bacterium]